MTIISKPLRKDGNMVWKVTTAPAIEPLTAEEIKTFGRIDGTSEDDLIEGFIKATRETCENYLRRALITQTITVKMDFWPDADSIELPRPPLQSITSVETLDEDDTATTYSSSNYYTVTESIPGLLVLKRGVTPPQNYDRDKYGFRIIYKAGYGSAASNIPQSILEALKLWTMNVYENRVVLTDPPPEAKPLLDLYRVIMI